MNFSAHGKWILAGEHAVLRGVPALVFPLYSRKMTLEFEPSDCDLAVELKGEHGEELELLVWGLLERAFALAKMKRSEIRGRLVFESSIPLGAGLGASAALCVVVSRWLHALGALAESELYEFSRTLENLFHGESSGVDVAVALSNSALLFEREGRRELFQSRWQPRWYLSYTGKRGVTKDCVAQVKELIQKNGERGREIDERMRKAVKACEEALLLDQKIGFAKLVVAIHTAKSCFQDWGLIPPPVAEHLDMLMDLGASAVKPTGSGGGGFVLSLWPTEPPAEIHNLLIPCYSHLS